MKVYSPSLSTQLSPELFYFGADGELHMLVADAKGGLADVTIDCTRLCGVAGRANNNRTGKSITGGGIIRASRAARGRKA